MNSLRLNFVSAYTINTPYEQEVENLKQSLIKFGFSTEHIVPIDNLGSWEKNCQQKATVIKNKLLELKEPIIWLDADAVLNKEPELFHSIQKDLAICVYNKEYLSGTLYLKPTEEIHKLLDEWIIECNENPKELDQKILQKLILKNNVEHEVLPTSYCKVDFFKSDDNIIAQNQASRRFKKIINNKDSNICNTFNWTGGGEETPCGCGSMVKNMTNVIKEMPEILKKFNINSIIEIGCGDLNFAKHCILNSNVNYTGIDLDRFKTWNNYKNITLIQKNIEEFEKIESQMVICRDVFIHLPNKIIENILKKIKCEFLLATNSNIENNSNRQKIICSGYSPINMEIEPFNLGKPILNIEECSKGKNLSLWRF
jgi:hypothetical protein